MNNQLQQFLEKNNIAFDEYKKVIKNLNWLENKENFIWKDKFPISTNIFYLLQFLEQENCKYRIEQYWYLIQVKHPSKSGLFFGIWGFHLICKNTTIFNDKIYTKKILWNNWFNVLDWDIFFPIWNPFREDNFEEKLLKKINTGLLRASQWQLWFPIIWKPTKWSLWNWVEFIENELILKDIMRKHENGTELFMIEKYMQWNEFRIFYLDWFIFAYEKIGENITKNIANWSDMKEYILNKKESDFIESIAKLFGEKVFGLDLITNGSIDMWYILEINWNPWLKWLKFLKKHQKKAFWEKYWNLIKKENGICEN